MSVIMSNATNIPSATAARLGIDISGAGIIASVYSFASIVGCFLVPTFIMRRKNTKPLCVACTIVSAIAFFAAFNIANSIPAILVCNIISGFCISGLLGLVLGMPALMPEIGVAHAGLAGGIVATTMTAAGFIVPSFVVANIAGTNYGLTYTIIAIMCVIMGVMFALLPNIKGVNKHG
jgi:NNP family nitrate/nitrite transporter-like MFS transporter